ncbi:MAG: response regulator [Pirellulaceae bacterium]|nr:response regulator [Pirellulaceae bacterium]
MNTTVLIVDDSATVRQQVGIVLTQSGFKVEHACDGIEGVLRIQSGGIDCVICDVNMPNMNGLELVEAVKSCQEYSKLPIIMLTTEGAKELILRAKKAGASGWIVKPFKADLLVAAVQKLTASTVAV